MKPSGFLPVLKMPGPTSHDVVQVVRRRLQAKVGHLGTLDPAAAGVLVLAVGEATRAIAMLPAWDKEYRAQLIFGLRTETDDATGQVLERTDASMLDEPTAVSHLATFVGAQLQRVPLYSAVSVAGERLHRLARRGERPEAPTREVTLYEAKLVRFEPGLQARSLVDLRVSSGYFVRSLARDLGESLRVGGVLGFLLRTRVGPFDLSAACSLSELRGLTVDRWPWQGVEQVFARLPRVDLGAKETHALQVGQALRRADLPDGWVQLWSGEQFFGVARCLQGSTLKVRRLGQEGDA